MPKHQHQHQRHLRDIGPALPKPQLCWKKNDLEWGRAMKGKYTLFVLFAGHWAFCEHEEPRQATPL